MHLSHFYNDATGTRYQRAQHAVHGVGVSVIGGAITTMGAGLPLFFTVAIFFYTLGYFIFFVALASLFFSFVFLLPALMIAGPEGSQGDLRMLVRMCRGTQRTTEARNRKALTMRTAAARV